MTYAAQTGLALAVVVACASCGAWSAEPIIAPPIDQAEIDFRRDVAPILEQHCLRCHCEEEAKGDVSLATLSGLLDSESVVVGDADASYFIDLITPEDGQLAEMPKESQPLSADQIAILRVWISQGASWPEDLQLEAPGVADRQWWSLRPIKADVSANVADRPTPATVAANPVDHFIDAQLAAQGLTPAPQADAIDLIRRVTYDLTGLPPSAADADIFSADFATNPEIAWHRLVDGLLASPGFGEKWGQHWLDLARYAETHGYDKDQPRHNAWPYRDYVIRSFNEDKPYARFVQEQIAGDALFPHEPDGVLGLGFLAAGPWDFIGHVEVGEGKVDGRIAKHLDRDEMVGAVFNAFMSTTVQCAQCHHHKFDPIRMEDYYRLHAVFAAVDRSDRLYDGLSSLQLHEQQLVREQLQNRERSVQQLHAQVEEKVSARAQEIDERIAELTAGATLETPSEYGYHSQIAATQDSVKWVQIDLGEARSLSEVRLFPAFDSFGDIGAGFGFPVRYSVQAANDAEFAPDDVQVLFDGTREDQPNPGHRRLTISADGHAHRFVRIVATKLAERTSDFIFALAELQVLDQSGENVAQGARVTSFDTIEAPVRWSVQNLTDGKMPQRLSAPQLREELYQLEERRAAIERECLSPDITAQLSEHKSEIVGLKRTIDQFPSGEFVYAAATEFPSYVQFVATAAQPRVIHLLHRGDIRSPGDEMTPGAPPLWDSVPAEFSISANGHESEARAALAKYITDANNPLTWRTIANRVWQWTFGQPLVGTPNDFGRMGMAPTHPDLLDYLAASLRDDPQQSIKTLVRLLVTSRAYRRASTHVEANATIDATNSYLWRAHRRRLTAEEFRDSVLAVSGALRLDERGGPSFEDFVVEKPEHSPHYQYHLHDPDDATAHRRTVYRFVVRSQPQPMLTSLDCPDPSISVPIRDESTTALQALTQWNNRFVEAMARRFAERVASEVERGSEPSADAESQVDFACRLALGRSASETERPLLEELLRTHGMETVARVLMNTSAFTYVE